MIRNFKFRNHHAARAFQKDALEIFTNFSEQYYHDVVKTQHTEVRVEWNFPEKKKFWDLSVNRKLLLLYAEHEFKTEIYFVN